MASDITPNPHDFPKRRIGTVPFRVAKLSAAVSSLCALAQQPRRATSVHFANAYSVALADTEAQYAAVLSNPEALTFSDGVPVTWVGKRAFPDLASDWQRVYGPDVMTGVFDQCQAQDLPVSHYLLGGAPETLAALVAAIERRWPRVRIAGAESPPFRPLSREEKEEQRDRILSSGATMVWVGLGTPKQDFVTQTLCAELNAVVLAVGAAFDFLAGSKPQAPQWMQRTGTEWLYRLATEPRRLARRYFWGNPRFLVAAAREPGLRRPKRISR